MSHELFISVLFPCRNEEGTIGACVREARKILKKFSQPTEVVVVDNGSTDQSALQARKAGARVVRCPIPGYGAALDCGLEAARGRYVLMLDADGSYDPASLPSFLRCLQMGCDLVVGNRFQGRIEEGAMPWKNRYLGNPILSFLGRVMTGVKIGDFHCGIRAFRRDVIRRLGLQSLGMEYASEMIVRAGLAGLRMGEVPVALRRDGRGRPSHLRPWRDGWRHLRFLLLFSPRWLFVIPGFLMILLGMVFGACCWAATGEDRQLETFFLFCLCASVGYQFFLFGLLIRIFGLESGLLPLPAGYRKIFHFLNLELGLGAGFLTAACGSALLGFGSFAEESLAMKPHLLAMLGGLFLLLGVQTVLASFLFSFFGLSLKQKNLRTGGLVRSLRE